MHLIESSKMLFPVCSRSNGGHSTESTHCSRISRRLRFSRNTLLPDSPVSIRLTILVSDSIVLCLAVWWNNNFFFFFLNFSVGSSIWSNWYEGHITVGQKEGLLLSRLLAGWEQCQIRQGLSREARSTVFCDHPVDHHFWLGGFRYATHHLQAG